MYIRSTTCNSLWQLACLLLLRDAFLPLPGPDAQAGAAAAGQEEDGAGQAEVFDPIFDEVRGDGVQGGKNLHLHVVLLRYWSHFQSPTHRYLYATNHHHDNKNNKTNRSTAAFSARWGSPS